MTGLPLVALESADLARRNLLHLRRTPALILSGLVEPVLFALLIGYVFGGSLGGDAYREFMLPGLLAQTVTFSASFTTIGLAQDLQTGMVDRFRALPISRLALLLGRTSADLVMVVGGVAVTTITGLAIGWRPHTGVLSVLAAFLLVLLYAFALSWIGAFIALVTPNAQVAGSFGLLWMFPVSFVSSGFVASATLPGPLADIAAWSPVSALANALRELFGNAAPPNFPPQTGWAAEHPIGYGLLCTLGLITVFATLSTWRYRNRTRG
ncbi:MULTISPECIES: ABC transporter permease [unclassified Crossiella]|uniref:ABC transporter permease n=1 Tax=unclassified Crossiella TaxID=2620835 RepID=UPI001FFF9A3F|nr:MULTISPECIES: ABC transporter permease [unclassified Crossiella]MCK2244593.1 ABC transporter permease [Crossiella sp. S99.2]MCK2258224.1 ABC transporter permease [Crossiella sp. S99.1]